MKSRYGLNGEATKTIRELAKKLRTSPNKIVEPHNEVLQDIKNDERVINKLKNFL